MFKSIAKGMAVFIIIALTSGVVLPMVISSDQLPMPLIIVIIGVLVLSLIRMLMWFYEID